MLAVPNSAWRPPKQPRRCPQDVLLWRQYIPTLIYISTPSAGVGLRQRYWRSDLDLASVHTLARTGGGASECSGAILAPCRTFRSRACPTTSMRRSAARRRGRPIAPGVPTRSTRRGRSRSHLDEVLDHAGARAGGRAGFKLLQRPCGQTANRVDRVDAGVVVTALADDGPDGDAARLRLRGERLAAPHLIDIEVVSACGDSRRRDNSTNEGPRSPLMTSARSVSIGAAWAADRSLWELRTNLTAYDAVYVACRDLDTTLLTVRPRLARHQVRVAESSC